MRLGMVTCRAGLGCFVALMQVTAVAASPDDRCFPVKNPAGIDIGRKVQVSFFMLFLSDGNGQEYSRNITKAFLLSNFGKTGIHLRVLVFFSGGGGFQIFHCGIDGAGRESAGNFDLSTLKELEQSFGVLFLLICGFGKYVRDLYVAFLFGFTGVIGITVACLRFTRKGGQKILLGLCPL